MTNERNIMKTTTKVMSSALVFAALASAAALAQANGMSVTRSDERQIKAGMTMDQVISTLGEPAERNKFMGLEGQTLTYTVAAADGLYFDVDFDSSGKVSSTNERVPYNGR
jgi:hypothetical protein